MPPAALRYNARIGIQDGPLQPVAPGGAWEIPRSRTRRQAPGPKGPKAPTEGAVRGGVRSRTTTFGDALRIRAARPARVLLVVQNAALRMEVSLVLMRAGYEVLTAGSGADAQTRGERWKPDVLLLRLDMPVNEGAAFLKSCRAAAGARVPAIVLGGDLEAGRAMGADLVLSTPLDLDELLRGVERFSAGL